MSNQIEIAPERISEIAILYADLGPKGKKVLDIILWYIKKFPIAYPSQSKIAKLAGCSRCWANYILKRANELGIIIKLKRAYSTCRYFCEDWLKNFSIKTVATKLFDKIRFTLEESKRKETHKEIPFPFEIERLPVDYETKNVLQCFSTEIVRQALDDLVYLGKRNTVPKPERYLIKRCLELSEIKKQKPNWKLKRR